MKIRTMKLREAHKAEDGSNSICSILWSSIGDHIVTASSSDNSIRIHDVVSPANKPKCLQNHHDGVTALALTPNSTCLASGSIDHSVKIYKFPEFLAGHFFERPFYHEEPILHPVSGRAHLVVASTFFREGGDFDTNITRFTLPIRALAFNKSGTILAAAGDDEGIKLVSTIDYTIARVLKGHKGSITSIAFDPKSEYLASVDSIGTVIFWELQSGNTIHVLKAKAPNNGFIFSVMNALAWSPDGEMLAVPGLKNNIIMYDRDTAEELFSLKGDHSQPICFLSWSPNGKYMATSGLDKQILIWDVDKKLDIDRQKFSDCISGMSWKSQGNALAVIDVMGKYGVWESVVPSTMKSPTEDIPALYSKNSNGLSLFETEEEPISSGSLSDLNEDSFGEAEPSSRKRLRKKPKLEDEGEEDNYEWESVPKVESRKKAFHGQKDDHKRKSESLCMVVTSGPKMQVAFQPGATSPQPGKRHFLCYNMVGSITSMEHDGFSHIEVDFHDTSSGPRVPAMTDHFGFTMASLNDNGSVFANPCKGEKSMSTLMYRPFSSWQNNSEWSMRFEGEEIRAIALGSAWVAAITSLNFLRIFTIAGLQKDILSLDGPVVTAAGYMDELAIVTHISPSLPSDEQMLEFRLFNISERQQLLRGRLPLTPGSCLTWFGFSEEGQLSSFDSAGVLRVFTNQYGGSWLPLFSANKQGKPDDNYWVAGLDTTKLFCIVCKSPETFPQCTPKPVLTLLDLSFPLASSDLGADNLENEFMMHKMHLSLIQNSIEAREASGHDTSALNDEAFNLETSLDRCILKLIASCCNGDKLERAVELVKLLVWEKSIRGAIKIVTSLKLPNLAERFNDILEEKLLETQVENTKVPDFVPDKCIPFSQGMNTKSEGKVSSPVSSVKKQKVDDSTKDGKRKNEENQKTTPKMKTKDNSKDVKDGNIEEIEKVKEVIPSRPSNPFAKSSSNQKSSSVFDSFKKKAT